MRIVALIFAGTAHCPTKNMLQVFSNNLNNMRGLFEDCFLPTNFKMMLQDWIGSKPKSKSWVKQINLVS